MEIKILKGTNQIGGCITEISTTKSKIIIDFGEDLPDETKIKNEKITIEGLNHGPSTYDAVFITHSHADHIGLINEINKDIDVYVEEKSLIIHNLTCAFTNKDLVNRDIKNITFNKPVLINNGDLKITPYLVDHSSFHSCMFLIEGEGKKVLHTGDYRNHGRVGSSFSDTLNSIGQVDALITEGTTFSRNVDKYETEGELTNEAISLFQKYDDVLVLQSSTNIDRIISFYKASQKTNKNFVEDLFTANITMNLSPDIPNPKTSPNLSIWVPNRYNKKPLSFKENYITPLEQYKSNYAFHNKVCMMVKESMLNDIKMLYTKKNKFKKSCLVYSMWEGYIENDTKMQQFLIEILKMHIDIIFLHTSGHADKTAMQLVDTILKPKVVIPIHTTNKEYASEVFRNVVILEDNESINI